MLTYATRYTTKPRSTMGTRLANIVIFIFDSNCRGPYMHLSPCASHWSLVQASRPWHTRRCIFHLRSLPKIDRLCHICKQLSRIDYTSILSPKRCPKRLPKRGKWSSNWQPGLEPSISETLSPSSSKSEAHQQHRMALTRRCWDVSQGNARGAFRRPRGESQSCPGFGILR